MTIGLTVNTIFLHKIAFLPNITSFPVNTEVICDVVS